MCDSAMLETQEHEKQQVKNILNAYGLFSVDMRYILTHFNEWA